MPDAPVAVEAASIGPRVEAVLKKPIDTISEPVTNMLLGLCDPAHSVRLVRRRSEALKTRVQVEDGGKTLALPKGDLTAEELLRAALLLDPDVRKDKNPPSPLRQFAGNLQSGAILLAKEMKERGVTRADELVQYLYNSGSRLDAEIKGTVRTFAPKTLEEIQAMEITYPDSVTTPEQVVAHNREIEFYLLFGKNIILLPGEKGDPDNAVAERTVYELLYKKWREKQGITGLHATTMGQLAAGDVGAFADSWELRQRFEKEYLDKVVETFHRFPLIAIDFMEKSLQAGRGEFAVETLIQTGASQQLFGEAMMGVGEKHLTGSLPVSEFLRANLLHTFSVEEVDRFLGQYDLGAEGEVENLFQKAAKMAEQMNKENVNPRIQMEALFDLVSAFPSSTHKGGSINEFARAASAREFDCTMKSLLLGRLLQEHLSDSLYIFGLTRIRHVELIVMGKDPQKPFTLGLNANTTYMTKEEFDAQAEEKKKEPAKVLPGDLPIGLDDIPERSFDGTSDAFTGIQKINDDQDDPIFRAVSDARRLYDSANPQFYHVDTLRDGLHTTLTIGPWERTVQEAILGNLISVLPQDMTSEIATMDYLISLGFPASQHMYSLGENLARLGQTEEAKVYLERGLELFPDYFKIWIYLGNLQTDPQQRIRYLRQAVSLDTFEDESWVHLGAAYVQNEGVIEDAVSLGRQCFRKAVTLNPNSMVNWFNVGAMYAEQYNMPPASLEECDEAIFAFERFLKFPDDGSNWYKQYATSAQQQIDRVTLLRNQFLP